MTDAITEVPIPVNEPIEAYAPGSPVRATLEAELGRQRSEPIEVPAIIGGRRVESGALFDVTEPHDTSRVLGRVHLAGAEHVEQAVAAGRAASASWAGASFEDRASVFLKAADLLAGPWRARINAATMLGQSKTAFQAEIDAACELIDFFRFNVGYARQLMALQPESAPGMWNRCEYRNLEGFVFAVTPFNFTSIGGNLPTAPALMGNVALWKPATTAAVSNFAVMELLEAAGLPPGVINFVPGRGPDIGTPALAHPELAGVHFTGSTPTFQTMWRTIGENIASYRSYPRIVGETGGKDFVFAHPSADVPSLVTALLRGAFEYQGQKCSAASRAFIPRSLWGDVKQRLAEEVGRISMGDPTDFSNFMCAVIDEKSFEKCKHYIDQARADPSCSFVTGGECDRSTGWFVQPTVIETTDPKAASMCEEIFGPILTVLPYDDVRLDEALDLCDTSSPYALTGAVFAQDRHAVAAVAARLRHTAGNFYINDKPTGAVVGQQPFGGSRASGTNDKAGSMLNLIRWTSVRTIKETFVPATDWRYPHMGS